MSLLFIIQAHQSSAQTVTFAEAMTRRGHTVVISLDALETDFLYYQNRVGDIEHCHIIDSGRVTWCGYSQVTAYLSALYFSLSLNFTFDYIINLSTSCVLIKPISMLETYLQLQRQSSVDGFIWSFASNWDRQQPEYESHHHDRDWVTFPRYAGRNISVTVPTRLREVWEDIGDSPIVKAHRRFSYYSIDQNNTRSLFIRTLTPFERKWRSEYFAACGIRIGRSWFVLSSDLAESMLSTCVKTEAWGLFSSSFEPDECLLHNIVFNHMKNYRIQIDNLHLGYGLTTNLTPAQYSAYHAGSEKTDNKFFLRKYELNAQELLMMNQRFWSC